MNFNISLKKNKPSVSRQSNEGHVYLVTFVLLKNRKRKFVSAHVRIICTHVQTTPKRE